MGTFISSKDCVIFCNFLQEGSVPNTGSHFFAAKNISFSTDVQLEPSKIFGQSRISNSYGISGPQQGKLSMEIYPLIGSNSFLDVNNQMALITGMTGDFSTGHSLSFNNFLLKQCYLSSLNLQISPQEPISVKAGFDCFDLSSITGQSFTGANIQNFLTTNGSGAYLDSIHALAMGVSGSGTSLPQSKLEININYSCSREAVYGLGASVPSTVILTNITRETSIKGESVGKIITYSGNNAALNLSFSPFSSFIADNNFAAQSGLFDININGKVTSQAMEVNTDNGLGSVVVVNENLF